MDRQSEHQGGEQQSKTRRVRPNGPIIVGAFFAILAIVLTLVGLWRQDNLSLRNVVLGVVLCGGSWGLVSWAIAAAAVQVEEDVSSNEGEDD